MSWILLFGLFKYFLNEWMNINLKSTVYIMINIWEFLYKGITLVELYI